MYFGGFWCSAAYVLPSRKVQSQSSPSRRSSSPSVPTAADHPPFGCPRRKPGYHLDFSSLSCIKSPSLLTQSPNYVLRPSTSFTPKLNANVTSPALLAYAPSAASGWLSLSFHSAHCSLLKLFCHRALASTIAFSSLPCLNLFTGSAFLLGSSPLSIWPSPDRRPAFLSRRRGRWNKPTDKYMHL